VRDLAAYPNICGWRREEPLQNLRLLFGRNRHERINVWCQERLGIVQSVGQQQLSLVGIQSGYERRQEIWRTEFIGNGEERGVCLEPYDS
jgi:hypothetical protein